MKASSVQIKHICLKMTGQRKREGRTWIILASDSVWRIKMGLWKCAPRLGRARGCSQGEQGCWGSSHSEVGTTEGPGDPGAHGA